MQTIKIFQSILFLTLAFSSLFSHSEKELDFSLFELSSNSKELDFSLFNLSFKNDSDNANSDDANSDDANSDNANSDDANSDDANSEKADPFLPYQIDFDVAAFMNCPGDTASNDPIFFTFRLGAYSSGLKLNPDFFDETPISAAEKKQNWNPPL